MVDFKILIAEHDKNMKKMMSDTLKDSFKTEVVETGAEALKKIATFKPEIVFIDFQIDDMSSIELQQEIAKNYPEVHAVMMSNIDRSKISLQSMKKRAMDYLYRSEDAERFLSDVCKLVRWLIDIKYQSPKESALVASGFYDLAKKLYEEKKWSVEEIEKILEERNK
ncbi:MAG: response regulator [Candidatus Omnitrophica bacterium]|nr:response regulator [Candidatus Omnitrophota bacterium]